MFPPKNGGEPTCHSRMPLAGIQTSVSLDPRQNHAGMTGGVRAGAGRQRAEIRCQKIRGRRSELRGGKLCLHY